MNVNVRQDKVKLVITYLEAFFGPVYKDRQMMSIPCLFSLVTALLPHSDDVCEAISHVITTHDIFVQISPEAINCVSGQDMSGIPKNKESQSIRTEIYNSAW